jgi:hypothetical protein
MRILFDNLRALENARYTRCVAAPSMSAWMYRIPICYRNQRLKGQATIEYGMVAGSQIK